MPPDSLSETIVGDAVKVRPTRSALPLDRFLAKCRRDVVSGCLIYPTKPGRYAHMWVDGKVVSLHRLALELYVARKLGIPGRFELPAGALVRHLPGCTSKACLEPNHLACGTRSDNAQDAIVTGTIARGERNGMARLRITDVRRIRRAPRTGRARRRIAAKLGVNADYVRHVQYGRTWSWVQP